MDVPRRGISAGEILKIFKRASQYQTLSLLLLWEYADVSADNFMVAFNSYRQDGLALKQGYFVNGVAAFFPPE